MLSLLLHLNTMRFIYTDKELYRPYSLGAVNICDVKASWCATLTKASPPALSFRAISLMPLYK